MGALIVGFIFTPEVYTRVNSILLAKFGKPSEVAAARLQCMTSLPFFSNSSPNKIHKFYKKLFSIVQVLDKMNKVRDIKVYERLTLDKLPEFMGDFVRLDDE